MSKPTFPISTAHDERDSHSGLSGGAIAGIILGVLAAVGLFAALFFRRFLAKSAAHENHPGTPRVPELEGGGTHSDTKASQYIPELDGGIPGVFHAKPSSGHDGELPQLPELDGTGSIRVMLLSGGVSDNVSALGAAGPREPVVRRDLGSRSATAGPRIQTGDHVSPEPSVVEHAVQAIRSTDPEHANTEASTQDRHSAIDITVGYIREPGSQTSWVGWRDWKGSSGKSKRRLRG